MPLAYLTLFTGLAISAVAIYYSVIGLAAIFSAAVIPIIVMGAILEVSKLVAAWWLKANWDRAPFLLKSYMLVAVVVLMLITSMGIFGFLSKAHTDQAIVTGDVQAQVYLIDEQIKVERENIANAQSLIKQLDDAVIGIQAAGNDREIKMRDGSTVTQSSAERALQVRRAQARDRANLTGQIEESQKKILELQQKKAPIAANMREVEAKVGPIKYIAQLIYGEDPDENLLEKAVTWVIITIVFVFDPLAVLLLLASQMSFQWARPAKEERNELVQEDTKKEEPREKAPPPSNDQQGPSPGGDTEEHREDQGLPRDNQEPEDKKILEGSGGQDQPQSEDQDKLAEEANAKIAEIETEPQESIIPEDLKPVPETVAEEIKTDSVIEEDKKTDQGYDSDGYGSETDEDELEKEKSNRNKVAMQAWKADNPNDSLKHQRLLFEQGLIDRLPWEEYLKAESDYYDNEAALEAAKWAQEQIEETKKKEISWIEKEGNQQIRKTKEI
jgi:hypothetical protein